MPPFAHLHVHTEYSLLDGLSRIKDLVSYTKDLGMDAVAITDHGAMYGVMEFYRAAKAQDVKPIIGLETYLAPRGMTDKDPQHDRRPFHLLLLAENQSGYQNLLKIASASQLEGYYYRPRIDKEFLAAHSEGLVCTTGCLAAEIPQMLMQGRDEEARRQLGWWVDVFGRERFFIELQHHNIEELHAVNDKLYKLGPYADLQFLATNDVHYVRREDAATHDVLLAIQTSSLLSDPKRMRFTGDTFYVRSPQEMWDLFGEIPESLENTVRVAERCNVNLDDTDYKLPQFPVPDGMDAKGYLRQLCEEGLHWRYGNRADSHEVRERLEHELRIIHEMGFDTYFLIVWDLCEFAKQQDIWWNVRGSGAGSVVAYSLGITGIDPLRNGLIFERFLNPGRISMPDIDIDYPDDRRAEMIQYCVDRYGEDKVSQIITFGTLGARAAVRDVGRAMDIDLDAVDRLARTIPAIPGKPVTLRQMLDDTENPEYRDFHDLYLDKASPFYSEIVDASVKLEGIARHASTHAAGVLVADAPLVEYTPLNRPTSSSSEGLKTVSQWPMEIVESIGLLKVDFLGLRTLTVMRKACELIEQNHDIAFDLGSIPYRHIVDAQTENDVEHNRKLDAAFELLSVGDTGGVFQVEGEGMTRTLVNMQPSRFEHIIAAISLFRPGPLEYIPTYIRRMHGKEEVSYHHDLLEPILDETYGIIVYQEQIMRIASDLFGYDLGDADLMRRAVAKKKEKELIKHKRLFKERGPANGVSPKVAERIFDDIEFFARYGFNKSHAADYAVLTVQTAYLKAHYPHEYMAALLTLEHADSAKVSRYINECRRLGIDVLPPRLNESFYDFQIEEDEHGTRSIRFGLCAIKNVGDGSIETTITAREEGGPFETLDEFCQRTDLRQVGRRALECMVKVGVFDEYADRSRLLASVDRMMSLSTSHHRAMDVGQLSLFGEATGVEVSNGVHGGVLTDIIHEEIPNRELLQYERELIGVYVTEHPLDKVQGQIHEVVTMFSDRITEEDHGKTVMMAGVVTDVRPHTTRTGKPMGFAEVEDQFGTISVVVWPRTWEETRDLWEPDRIIFMKGRLDAEGRGPKLLCEEASTQIDIIRAEDPPDLAHYSLQPVTEEPMPPASEEPSLEEEAPSVSYDDFYGYPPPEDPAPEEPAGRHIRVHMARTGDPKRDRRRLEQIWGVLHGSTREDCDDTFSIVLVNGKHAVEIAFEEKTCYDDAIEQLIAIVGSEAISVEGASRSYEH